MKRILLLAIIMATLSLTNAIDLNMTMEIPVANIALDGAFADWANVPVAIYDSSSGAIENDFKEIKIATNSAKTILYLYATMYGAFGETTSTLIFNISNDKACNGYKADTSQGTVGVYPICSGALIPGLVRFWGASEVEISIDLTGVALNNKFLVSGYSTGTGVDHTSSRWIKFR